MGSLLGMLDAGITIIVPAVVWTLLAVGLYQLIRESVHKPRALHQRTARQTHS